MLGGGNCDYWPWASKNLRMPLRADPSGRAVYGVGLRPFACWDCGFESRRGKGCLSLVSVVCCQAEISSTGWSLVQRSPTECGVSECDREASKTEAALAPKGLSSHRKKKASGCPRTNVHEATCLVYKALRAILLSEWHNSLRNVRTQTFPCKFIFCYAIATRNFIEVFRRNLFASFFRVKWAG
jgi:hypothetical protein